MHHTEVSDQAKIHGSVIIGPYTIIERDVEVGARTSIGSHVIIKNGSLIGEDNKICAGAQIGVDPQDYHFKGEPSRCCIGKNNIIREYSSISRATGRNKATIIGDNNFIMTYVHIAHNTKIGNDSVIASGSQLGGYVEVDDFVNIGGLAGIHQFCKIGKYAMLGAMSYLNKDIPPYFLARGNPAKVYGVNIRGLQRMGFTVEDIAAIKELYHIMYRSSRLMTESLKRLKEQRGSNMFIDEILKFIETSKRGILLKHTN